MKQKLKIIVYLALAAIVFSCAEEKDFVKEQNHSKIKMEEKSFKELLQFPAFNEAYRKVVKSENVMSNEFMARTALEEQYGFDIVADSPVKVITDAENGVFYIMLIERPIIENLKFENLIINIKDFEIGAVIMKYELANLPENIEEHNSYKLTILSTEMTALEVQSRTLFGGCVTTATLKCNDTRGGYPPNHDASTFCIENSNNLYYTWNTVCEGMNDSAGGNGPSSSSGSSTSSGTHTTGGTSSNGNNVSNLIIMQSPIPSEESVDFDTVPCPGDPIKEPKICPSSISNPAGGTFGCTRVDPRRTCDGYIGKKKHAGIDIKGAVGDKIFNMHSGVVVSLRSSMGNLEYKMNSLGNFIEIESTIEGETVRIKYCHLGNVKFSIGQSVPQGAYIGNVGRSGNAASKSVTTHLHIQSKKQIGNTWNVTNPINYFATTFNQTTFVPETDCN